MIYLEMGILLLIVKTFIALMKLPSKLSYYYVRNCCYKHLFHCNVIDNQLVRTANSFGIAFLILNKISTKLMIVQIHSTIQ